MDGITKAQVLDAPKTCISCKHFRRDYPLTMFLLPVVGWVALLLWWAAGKTIEYAKCGRSRKETDIVSGRRGSLFYCSTERRYDCGRNAKFWQSRS